MTAVKTVPVRGLAGEDLKRFNATAGEYRSRFSLLDTQLAARFE